MPRVAPAESGSLRSAVRWSAALLHARSQAASSTLQARSRRGGLARLLYASLRPPCACRASWQPGAGPARARCKACRLQTRTRYRCKTCSHGAGGGGGSAKGVVPLARSVCAHRRVNPVAAVWVCTRHHAAGPWCSHAAARGALSRARRGGSAPPLAPPARAPPPPSAAPCRTGTQTARARWAHPPGRAAPRGTGAPARHRR
jgi:hypothetical protein